MSNPESEKANTVRVSAPEIGIVDYSSRWQLI
jgi:hypothetical protein